MRIGITGVTGYIGGAVAQFWSKQGHEIIGFSRKPADELPLGVAEVRLLGPNADYSGLDALLLLGAEPIFGIWTPKKAKSVWASRVEGTEEVCTKLKALSPESRPKVLISASGIGFYGDRGDEWLPEGSVRGEDAYFANLTHAWERAALAASDVGIRVVCARIGVVLGVGSPACDLLGKVFRAGIGGKLGTGKQWFSWVDQADLVNMFAQILENDALSGPINCVSPNPVTNSELTRQLAAKVKRPAIIPVPAFALKIGFRQLSQTLLGSQRVEPAILREHGFRWQAKTLEEALERAFS